MGFLRFAFFLFPILIFPFLNDIYALPKATLLWLSVPFFFLWGSFRPRRNEVPIYLWIIMYFFFSAFSLSPFLSFWGNYRYYFHGFFSAFAGFCLFLILKKRPEKENEKLFAYFTVSLFISALIGVFVERGGRLSATFGNPNFLGGVLAMVLPFCFYLSKRRKIYAFFFFSFLIFLLLTFSRASWLGATAGILFLFAFSDDRNRILEFFGIFLLILFFTFLFERSFFLSLAERFLSIFNLKEGDIVSRFQGYAATVKIFKLHPIIGRGPETFLLLFRQNAPAAFVEKIGALAHAGYTHSYPLQILVDFGLLGFVAYIFLILFILLKAVQSKDVFKIAAGSAIFAHFSTNLFAFPTVTQVFLFWFFSAIIFSSVDKKPHPVRNKRIRKVLFAFSFLFFLAPMATDFLFKKGVNSFHPGRSHKYFKIASNLVPQDYHLMNIGRKYIEFYKGTKDVRWLDRAKNSFARIIKRNKYDALAFNGMGVVWKEFYKISPSEKSFVKAEKNFKESLRADPFLKAAYLNLALLYEKEGFFERAVEIYKKALRIYPDDATLRFNFGVVSADAGDLIGAMKAWQSLEKTNPGYPKLKKYIKEAEELIKKRKS